MARRALLSCAVAAALAACSSGAAQQSSPLGATIPGATHRAVPVPAASTTTAIHPNRAKSWISPDAKNVPRLLFISDYGASDVDIFSMPDMTLKGTLTGFSFPEGECNDTNGNIWIANTGGQQLLLYSRTGSLLKTLNISGEYPAACAVSRSNGDLAVANIESSTAGPGNIMVFPNGSGSGTAYTNSSISEYFFVGYDRAGNLYFDGTDATRTSSYLAELPAGSSNTELINLTNGTLHLAGFVQWYRSGNYLALGDQQCNGSTQSCVYWVNISGSSGTITGTTTLVNSQGGQVCDLVQGVIAASHQRYLAGPDYESCGYTASTAYRWHYDAGGTPTNYNDTAAFTEPIGAAISAK